NVQSEARTTSKCARAETFLRYRFDRDPASRPLKPKSTTLANLPKSIPPRFFIQWHLHPSPDGGGVSFLYCSSPYVQLRADYVLQHVSGFGLVVGSSYLQRASGALHQIFFSPSVAPACFSIHSCASLDLTHSPATCLVATLMRFQKLIRAILRTRTASDPSS